MAKAFFVLMYLFVALFVLAMVPYEVVMGLQMLQAPVVWVILAGWVLVIFPCPVVRLLLAPLRAILLLLVWLGTLLLAITKLVLVALNRVNRDLAGEAHHDR
ncbi:hypothetical protein [Aeromonas caviae]|uniref:hypothetical protein n=1 Tax=Aeromonas caviae TaxID=648 RepID=UPI0015DCDFC4|nr:hypothetical protein [Aeromonas caviae]BBR09253.1 hypothetical protein WP3S18E02_09140 [Aeromonas caviae]